MKGITKQMKEDEVHLWEKGGSLQKELEDFEQWMLDIVNNRKMKNQPKFVYLQTGLEECGETCSDFDELDMVSWCADKIYSDDLKYVSVFSVLARIKELEKEIENEDSVYSEASCRFRIDELKNLIK
jgi:hypothetical protein